MDQGTILLVEDHDEIADLVRMYVEREGFTLSHARSGEEGLVLLAKRKPRAAKSAKKTSEKPRKRKEPPSE